MSDTTIAQVEAPQPVAADQSNQVVAPAVSPGVQERIDELTAEKHATQRELDAFKAREQIYIQELTARSRAPAEPAAPRVEIDQSLREQMDAYLAPQFQRLNQYMQQLQTQNAVVQVRHNAVGLPDQVRSRAEELTMQYARQGQTIDAEMALTLAAGQIQREQWVRDAQTARTKAQFNQPNPVYTGQSGFPSPVAPQPQRRNYDAMGLDERARAMEEDGIGQIPL